MFFPGSNNADNAESPVEMSIKMSIDSLESHGESAKALSLTLILKLCFSYVGPIKESSTSHMVKLPQSLNYNQKRLGFIKWKIQEKILNWNFCYQVYLVRFCLLGLRNVIVGTTNFEQIELFRALFSSLAVTTHLSIVCREWEWYIIFIRYLSRGIVSSHTAFSFHWKLFKVLWVKCSPLDLYLVDNILADGTSLYCTFLVLRREGELYRATLIY